MWAVVISLVYVLNIYMCSAARLGWSESTTRRAMLQLISKVGSLKDDEFNFGGEDLSDAESSADLRPTRSKTTEKPDSRSLDFV